MQNSRHMWKGTIWFNSLVHFGWPHIYKLWCFKQVTPANIFVRFLLLCEIFLLSFHLHLCPTEGYEKTSSAGKNCNTNLKKGLSFSHFNKEDFFLLPLLNPFSHPDDNVVINSVSKGKYTVYNHVKK